MSAVEHSQWNGFPFSPNWIKTAGNGQAAKVNAASIPDASAPVFTDRAVTPVLPVSAPVILQPVPRAGHPTGLRQGMRLLPLAAFVWGSRAMPPQPRTRPDHTLIWVTKGRAELDFPRAHFILRAGDLHYIPAGTAFAAIPSAGSRGHVALISPDLAKRAEPPLPDHGMAAYAGSHAAQLEATLHELAVETTDPNARTLSCLIDLLSLRLGQLQPCRDPQADETAPPDLPLIERFLALADQRLGSARSVAELAAELHCTTAVLDHACLAARGKRAVEMIHDLQLKRAADLLRNTDRPLPRIAADLGYSSQAHFIRAFVAATGRSPDVFRTQSG